MSNRIERGFLSLEEQQLIVEVATNSTFKGVPNWLGNFAFRCYYNNSYQHTRLNKVVERLASLQPEQKFNTVFLQRYRTGAWVAEHRDPKNNVGVTIIGIAGDFTGAISRCTGQRDYQLLAGDIAIQPCTIDGVQGPRHSVTPVLSGTRYALILNTIK